MFRKFLAKSGCSYKSLSLQIRDNPIDLQALPLCVELRDWRTFLCSQTTTKVAFLGRTFGANRRWTLCCTPRGELFIIAEDYDWLMTTVQITFVLALTRSWTQELKGNTGGADFSKPLDHIGRYRIMIRSSPLIPHRCVRTLLCKNTCYYASTNRCRHNNHDTG